MKIAPDVFFCWNEDPFALHVSYVEPDDSHKTHYNTVNIYWGAVWYFSKVLEKVLLNS